MDEFEQYRRKPVVNSTDEDFNQYKRQQVPKKSFGEKLPAWLLGLGQFAEDTAVGQVTGTAQPEVDIPDFWKPEKIRSENQPERPVPTLGLEKYVEPGKESQFNAGRYGPAVLGLAAGLGGGAAAGARRLGNTRVGTSIVDRYRGLQNQFRNEYDTFFNTATNAGVNNIPMNLPMREFNVFRRSAGRDPSLPVQDFMTDPSLRNAHEAQSALARYIRSRRGKDNSPAQNRALDTARDMRTQIRSSMTNTLETRGGPELSAQYQDISNRFREQLVPYLNNKHVRNAALNPNESGFIEPWRLPAKMQQEGSDPLRRILEQQDPMFRLNRLLAGPLGKSAAGAVVATPILKALTGQR